MRAMLEIFIATKYGILSPLKSMGATTFCIGTLFAKIVI